MNRNTFTAILAKSLVLAPLWKFQARSQLKRVVTECQQNGTFDKHFEFENDNILSQSDNHTVNDTRSPKSINIDNLFGWKRSISRFHTIYKRTRWAVITHVFLYSSLASVLAAVSWFNAREAQKNATDADNKIDMYDLWLNSDFSGKFEIAVIYAAVIFEMGIPYLSLVATAYILAVQSFHAMLGIRLKHDSNSQKSQNINETGNTEHCGNLSKLIAKSTNIVRNCWDKLKIAFVPMILDHVRMWIEEKIIHSLNLNSMLGLEKRSVDAICSTNLNLVGYYQRKYVSRAMILIIPQLLLYPMETISARMYITMEKNPISAFRAHVRKHGFLSLYAGMIWSVPLLIDKECCDLANRTYLSST